MERSIDVQISACAVWWEEDPASRYIQTVWGWATSLCRTVPKAARRCASRRSSFARTLLLIVTLLVLGTVTTYW